MSWKDLVDVLAPEVLLNARETSDRLRELGVPHAVIGGVAVGFHGHPRATKDVDFLIGREGEGDGNAEGFSDEVHELYEKDVIDFLTVRQRQPEAGLLLEALTKNPATPNHVPVIGPKELVWLKLSAKRPQDLEDLRRLIVGGAIDPEEVLDWLDLLDESKAEDFSEVIQQAMAVTGIEDE